jgi:hypothetical protein
MENIPLIGLSVSSVLSVAALIISGLSLWNARTPRRNSEDAQYHTQIVSFEQRKYDVRQILFQRQILTAEINGELNRFPDSKWLREKFSELAVVRYQNDKFLKDFDAIPSSPSTETRLKLERIGGAVMEGHLVLQNLLKVVRESLPSK